MNKNANKNPSFLTKIDFPYKMYLTLVHTIWLIILQLKKSYCIIKYLIIGHMILPCFLYMI